MRSYCVREKRETDCVPGTERTKITSNGRTIMQCECASCGITKTTFMPGRKAAKPHPGRKSVVDRNKERANTLRAIIRERQNVEHGMIRARVSRAALNAYNKETNRLIDQLTALEQHIISKDPDLDRYRGEYMFQDDPLDRYKEDYMFMDPIKPPRVDKRYRKDYMFEPDYRDDYMFIDPIKPPRVSKKYQRRYMFQDDPAVRDEDVPKLAPQTNPKSWKQTTGITPAVVERRMNRYYDIDNNPSDMRKVENLLRKLTAKKPGTESRLGKLIDIKKVDNNRYAIQYWTRFGKTAKPLRQTYHLVDRFGLEDFLKKYVAGVYIFRDDKLATVNF